jgi:hypothetical protein
MNTEEILLHYLATNDIVNKQGGDDILEKATVVDNESDQELIKKLANNNEQKDLYMLLIFIVLGITFLVIIYKLIANINDTTTTGACMVIIITLIAIMHRVCRDKARSAAMITLLPLLDKKDRLKFLVGYTNDKGTIFNLNLKNAFSAIVGMKK